MRDLGNLSFFPTSPAYEVSWGIHNRNIMLVTRTQWVLDVDAHAIVEGMKKIAEEVGLILQFLDVLIPLEDSPEGRELGYPNSFTLQRDLWHGLQINSCTFSAVLRDQNAARDIPVLEMVLIASDLASPDMSSADWVYGVSSYPVHIISTARWDFDNDPMLRAEALQIVGAHELCHSYDLVNRQVNIGHTGLEASHCMGEVGPCIMEQVDIGYKTLVQMAQETRRRTKWLCSDCSQEIFTRLDWYRKAGLQA